ncbi:hypothetical protein M2164_005863 [Streptomyces sp. SAI-208]|uniref:hypothetical protein n=1 Tax=Streptomyces sp. SAI-208 TaxID=2940550 RepID=UPI0024772CE7|nr:hypothetical protein [Streptomyces sp. SAI-208]MDH6610228.1 hypothetical protein [Streptomyces sp. SAI-208]
MTTTSAPLWAVASCRTSADVDRTPPPITAADVPAARLTAVLAPTPTTPEESQP